MTRMMPAKTWKTIAAAMLIVMGTAFRAEATVTVTPNGPGQVLTGPETSQAAISIVLNNYFEGLGLDIDFLYKNDQVTGDADGVSSGGFADSYSTAYSNTQADPEDALITWNGGSFINSNPVYLLVKDGNSNPAWYLFNISGWDGKENIVVDSFWAGAGNLGRGAISHVSIYGGTSTTRVPDGGSMAMLLGIALLGLAGTRRMLS